jgi:hypothetical protein
MSIPCFIHMAYSYAVKMEAAGSWETLVRIFWLHGISSQKPIIFTVTAM